MKKLSKRATDFIELFFKTSINNITLKRHDIDVLYSHYKYSWYEFEKLDNEIQRLNNIINELEKWLEYEIYCDFSNEMTKAYQDSLDKLKELKGE